MLEYLVFSEYSRVGARVLCRSEDALNSRFKSFFVLGLRNTIMEQALGTSGVERMKSQKKGVLAEKSLKTRHRFLQVVSMI